MEGLSCSKKIRSLGINGEGELRGQRANPGLPGKMAVKTVYVCNVLCRIFIILSAILHLGNISFRMVC